MITIMFHATAKVDKVEAFRAMAIKATEATRAKDEGCITYVFHQQRDNPQAFVVYEQWQDQEALDAHIAHLQRLFGPPAPGRRLPAALLDLCEETQAIRYDVVA
jgi:quinol monooxygenase YgiN